MADYGGYFLKGLAGGLQTGLNMGQQIQEMQWQKKQRKALEEKQAKMVEVSNLWNAKIKEIYADNKATDEETAQLTTIYLSGGYEFMEHYQGAMNAIKSMNEKAYNQEIEWINLFIETSAGLPSGDIQAAFDIITPYVTSEKGRNTLEAYSNLQKKRTEALQAQPEDVWGQAGKLPAEIRPEYLRSKGIDIPKAETPETETEMDILKKNKTQLDFYYSLGEKAFDNFVNKHRDKFPSVTFKTYGKGYEEPEAITVGEPKTRATSLTTLEKYRENALNADTWEDAQSVIKDYTEAGYDVTQLGIDKEAWANSQKGYLNNIKKALDNLVDEKGWLKKGKFTKDQVGLEFTGERTAEEIYKILYEQYMKYFNMLTKMGLPLLEFPILKPLEKIEKVGFIEGLKTFGGVGKGQYKSIYY